MLQGLNERGLSLWCAFAVALVLACVPAEAGIVKKAAKAVVYTQGARVAGKFIAKKLEEREAKKSAQMAANRQQGKFREQKTEQELRNEHPSASVQREQYLRDADGKIAKDPRTGEARRLDHVVVDDGKVIRKVETTGMDVPKLEQLQKEGRIIESGGRYIRDRETGKLLPVDEVEIGREIVRRLP